MAFSQDPFQNRSCSRNKQIFELMGKSRGSALSDSKKAKIRGQIKQNTLDFHSSLIYFDLCEDKIVVCTLYEIVVSTLSNIAVSTLNNIVVSAPCKIVVSITYMTVFSMLLKMVASNIVVSNIGNSNAVVSVPYNNVVSTPYNVELACITPL